MGKKYSWNPYHKVSVEPDPLIFEEIEVYSG